MASLRLLRSNFNLVFRKETTSLCLNSPSSSIVKHKFFHNSSYQQRTLSGLCFRAVDQLQLVSKRSKYTRGKDGAKNLEEDDYDDEGDLKKLSQDPAISADVDGKDIKLVKTKLNSLRLDGVLKAGLGTAKNKVDEAFYESKIRINGEKALKKSKRMDVGDEIDLIKGPNVTNPAFLDVGRVIILVADFNADLEKVSVVLKRYRNLTIENYSHAPYKGGSG